MRDNNLGALLDVYSPIVHCVGRNNAQQCGQLMTTYQYIGRELDVSERMTCVNAACRLC